MDRDRNCVGQASPDTPEQIPRIFVRHCLTYIELVIDILPTRWAAGVPHWHVLAALALDVVPDDARPQQAAARAGTGRVRHLVRVVEHVRTT